MPSTRHEQLPPRLLPILYFALSHAALATAWAAVAADPLGVAGFFYHARMLAVVHLVTLGWITASILGSLYLVGPIAMRVRVAATWLDYSAFGFVAAGIAGLAGQFWLQEVRWLGWAGAAVGAGILVVGARVVPALIASPLPRAVTAHIALAFVNIALAAALGVAIGFDKLYGFLPWGPLPAVFAHAHLAAIGWATMMAVGVAYRLLPMILPAQMPSGGRLWTSALLLEVGVVGLAAALLSGSRFAWVFALTVVAGIAAFLSHVVWMVRHPRPRPPAIRMPDPAVAHAAAAFASLVLASVLGVWLTLAEPSIWFLRGILAYGVVGLIGFLSQLVVGMEGRLLPLFAWYWAYANTDFKGPVPSPHVMAWRGVQELIFVLWLFGVPSLAAGLAFGAVPFVRAAAWCLLAATLLDTLNMVRIVRHAFWQPAHVPSPPRG